MADSDSHIPQAIGDYRIDGVLGVGGMGEVYRAWDPHLERAVAIKLIRDDYSKSPAALERFRREAQVVAQLDHPAIVRVHHIQMWHEHPCIVMELVDGEPLVDQVSRGPLAVERAVSLLEQIAEGLAGAHQADIIHRDLKTQNVIVTPEGRAKILDFGIAKRLVDPKASLSVTGVIVGTLHAMSPEQAGGGNVDGRADLFALGVLAYEMLTGTSPFRADTATETVARVIGHHPQPVRRLNPKVPAEISDLVARLLAKSPGDRPDSAREVASRLKHWRDRTPTTARSFRRLDSQAETELIGDVAEQPTLAGGVPNSTLTRAPTSPAGKEKEIPTGDAELSTADPSSPGRRIPRSAVAIAILFLFGIAVLGLLVFRQLSKPRAPLTLAVSLGAAEPSWRTTALEEALLAELRSHPEIRVLDGDWIRLSHPSEDSAPPSASFAQSPLADLADVWITGTWRRSSEPTDDGRLHLDLRLMRLLSGKGTSLQSTGADLFSLARSTAGTVAEALGLEPGNSESFASALPRSPDALRPYVEGMIARRAGDTAGARERFTQALTASGDHPLLLLALAEIEQKQGYENAAKATARKALPLIRSFPGATRLELKARIDDLLGDRESAVAGYEALYEQFPDEVSFGIAAMALKVEAGKAKEALDMAESLRPLALGLDAHRLDLAEAGAYLDLGELDRVQPLALRAAEAGSEWGVPLLEAEGRLFQGIALERLGESRAAQETLEKSYLLFQKIGDFRRVLDALREDAIRLAEQEGQFEQALKHFRDYRKVFADRGDELGEASLQVNEAATLIFLGRLEEARDLLEPTLGVFAQRDAGPELASASLNLGTVFQLRGNLEQARAHYERSSDIFRRIGDRGNLARAQGNLGEVLHDTGDLIRASERYAAALELEKAVKRTYGQSYILNRLSEVALLQGDPQTARSRLVESRDLMVSSSDTLGEAEAQLVLARLELEESNAGDAERLARASEATLLDAGVIDSALLAKILRAHALLQRPRPELDAAQRLYGEIAISASRSEDRRVRFETDLLATRLAIQTKQDPDGDVRKRLRELIAEKEAQGFQLNACEARLTLGELETDLGDPGGVPRLERAAADSRDHGWTLYARRAASLLGEP